MHWIEGTRYLVVLRVTGLELQNLQVMWTALGLELQNLLVMWMALGLELQNLKAKRWVGLEIAIQITGGDYNWS